MNTPRYSRTVTPSTNDQGRSASAPAQTGGSTAHYQDMLKRLETLRDRRKRHEFELERSEREIAECKAQAQALGVETLEDLEALVERQEAEDREALAKFEAELNEEEALLDGIDQRLADTQGT